MSRPVLLGIGGPVVGALVQQLGAVPGLARDVEFHLAPGDPAHRPHVPAALLERAAVVIAEAEALAPQELAALGSGNTLITLPRLEFPTLWPFADAHPPRDGLGGVPAPFGDRIALRVLQSGTPPANRRAAFDAIAPASLVDPDSLHDFVARDLFRRERECSIRVAGFILARFRHERLFHSPHHPAAPLLAVIMAQLLGHPALADLGEGTLDARLQAVLSGLESVFADQQLPLHPAIAAHFGLTWWRPELRYRQAGETRSFGEWVDWLLREPASMATGPGLAALQSAGTLRHVAELHPATTVSRVVPFFATPIDPAIAPLGADMLRPEAARYDLPATLIALLPDAEAHGESGVVQFQGQALADTLPDHPVPAFPPDPSPHRQDSRALLAFGPSWQQDRRGTLTLLPRLVAAARMRRQHPGLHVLLPQAARAPWLTDMLALLGLDQAAIWLPGAPVACTDLIVTGRLSALEPSPLAHAAARVISGMVPLGTPGQRLLYLRDPEGTARIANEPQLAATLTTLGFTTVDTDRLDLAQRITLLRHAAAVVAPQGPALAEMAYCPPGAAVLELLGPADASPVFWSLASVAGLRYGYVVGEATATPAPGGHYLVPIAMLQQAAGLMLA